MELKHILEVEKEIIRFSKRLKDAKLRFETDKSASFGCKESGSLKRAAMDLKNELTTLTK